jgi:hypothetical protein
MTDHYEQMSVAPDPSKAEELRRRLHARMANISTDGDRGRSALELDSNGDPAEWNVPTNELSSPEQSTTDRRTHRRRVLMAAAAIAVVAAAAGIAIRIDDASRVATTSPTPTTSRAQATIEQYASVIREHTVPFRDWIEREASCTHVECSFVQYVRERYLALRPLLVDFQQALAELPPPPDEIVPLVDRTNRQVSDAVSNVDLLLDCTVAYPHTPCNDQRHEAEAAYKRLPPVFRAWSPYTGD